MIAVGVGVYAACVDFMLKLAAILDVTYRDANALLLFVVWPAVTLGLLVFWIVSRIRLRRALARRSS